MNRLRRILFHAITLACLCSLLPGADLRAPRFDANHYIEHIKYLSSENLKGRGAGTPELEKAGEYIARQLRSFNLKPLNTHNYRQPFLVTTNARLGGQNRLEYSDGRRSRALEFKKEFQPMNFSDSAQLRARVVFAGYGITAREYNYDDFAGIDVKDKLILVLRHEPQEMDEKSIFAGKIYTEHSQFFSKAANAKMHGARGVLLVNDVANHSAGADEMEPFGNTVGPNNAGLPFVQVRSDVVEEWFRAAGKDLHHVEEAIDKELRPQSFAFPDTLEVSLRTDLKREQRTVHNVLAYLAGETDEYVIVGAHYDHLGLGEQFSLAPSKAGTPHVGADDNASGTAGVIELARYFSALPRLHRGLLFLAFSGEELGLLGSNYYVNNALLPNDKAVAMINMDMIGRVRDNKVYVGGTGTGTGFKALLDRLAQSSPLKLDYTDAGGYGSSDHTSFTAKQIPVLFFFSGLHGDYHKPSDTLDKIEPAQTARLLELVADTVTEIANAPDRPQFVKVAAPGGPQAAGTGEAKKSSGYGPYFGSIPDFAEPPKGVRFSDVREGSPAAKAGLRAGDILVEFDGKPIGNLYDFTYALRGKQVGDIVKVKVLRGAEEVEASVQLEKRQ